MFRSLAFIVNVHCVPLPYTSKHRFSKASTIKPEILGKKASDAIRWRGLTKLKDKSIERRVGPLELLFCSPAALVADDDEDGASVAPVG